MFAKILPPLPRRESRSEFTANAQLAEQSEALALLNTPQFAKGFNHDANDDMMNFSIPVNWDLV